NKFFAAVTASHPIPSPGRTAIRILYAAQVGISPPTFALFTNVASELHFSYEVFLKNQLREKFGFLGTPIRLQIRKRKRKTERDKAQSEWARGKAPATPVSERGTKTNDRRVKGRDRRSRGNDRMRAGKARRTRGNGKS